MAKAVFQPGDRVKLTAAYLKSIKAQPTDELWLAKGTVKEVKQVGMKTIIKVLWDGDTDTSSSFPQYLKHAEEPEPCQ